MNTKIKLRQKGRRAGLRISGMLMLFGFVAVQASAATIGYWRFEGGVAGNDIVTAVSEANSPTMNATQHGGNEIDAAYSSNVSNLYVFDPISNTYKTNTLSMYGPAGLAADDTQLVILGGTSLLTDDYTVEMFVQVTDPNNGNGAANLLGTDRIVNIDGTSRYNVNVGSSSVQFRVDTASDSSSTSVTEYGSPLEDGAWHHLAMTLDYNGSTQTTIELFVDYASAGSVIVDGQFSEFNDIRFGHDGSNDGVFDWHFDEVRITDSALDSSDFLQMTAVPEPGTLSLMALGFMVTMLVIRKRH